MRVLHLLDHSIPLHSGYTFRTRAILGAQRDLGWETEQVTSIKQGESKNATERVDGFVFHRSAKTLGAEWPVVSQFATIHGLVKRASAEIGRFRPNVLHPHSPSLNGAAALQLRRDFGIPVVYEMRGLWEDAAVDFGKSREGDLRYRLTRAHETSVLIKVDAIACICEGLRQEILGRGVPADKVFIVPNAVHVSQFAPITERDASLERELGLAGKPVIGFVGSFYPYEGLDLLIDAMPELCKHLPELRLLLVGGGMEEANLKAQVARLGLSERVIFTGRVDHHQVPRYSSLIDLFVFPRKKMRVTDLVTPLKPLESMAQTRLLAASDVGGHRELIRDGETGFLFKSDSVEALTEVCLRALRMPVEARQAVLDQALRFVREERDWGAVVKRYAPLYDYAQRHGQR